MVVTHDLASLDGQPRLNGRDATIAIIVNRVAREGVDSFCGSYGVSRKEVREALGYCMGEVCVPDFVTFCTGCRKNPRYAQKESARNFWEIARAIYDKEFAE